MPLITTMRTVDRYQINKKINKLKGVVPEGSTPFIKDYYFYGNSAPAIKQKVA